MILDFPEARAFAESVARLLERRGASDGRAGLPGQAVTSDQTELERLLDDIGWSTLAEDPGLVACAGLAGVELGRRLAPVREIDRLLGGGPMAGELVRSLGPARRAVAGTERGAVTRAVVRSEPVACAGGLEVQRVLELAEAEPIEGQAWDVAVNAWTAASVGYHAGLGEAALDLTTDYVRQRRAFGTTLAALGPVQQHLATAAALVRGVRLLAGALPDADALAHAGHAVAEACSACHQVTGAIGFTIEYPLHGLSQRARALAAWNDALLETLV